MTGSSLLQRISRKSSNPVRIAERVIQSPDLIEELIEGLNAKKATIKYRCEKVLRIISERQPALLYPQFDLLATMLDCENSILKWGAIMSIANLARADSKNKFESIFEKYFSPIPGPVMITAANIIGGSARIALAKPDLAERISEEILKVEGAKYKTPECRNVAIGHAIGSFDQFFDHVQDKDRIIRFVKKQLQNTRAPVRKRAEKFLKKRNIPF
ncbi:MAG: hypothetical protein LAP85_09345 [Acidobacteriia bacterium]|nr:hypothetical protein [Terriglobia bacterium]